MDLLGITTYFKHTYYTIRSWLNKPISTYKRSDEIQDILVYGVLIILAIKQCN